MNTAVGQFVPRCANSYGSFVPCWLCKPETLPSGTKKKVQIGNKEEIISLRTKNKLEKLRAS